MKRSLTVGLLSAALMLWAPGVTAQVMIGAGGSVTFPTGDFADFANTGWLAGAGISFGVGGDVPVSVGASGYFGSNNHEPPPDGDKTNVYGAVAGVSYAFGDPEAVSPFIGAFVGFLTHSFKSDSQPQLEVSDSGLALGGQAGIGFPLGGVAGFVQGFYLTGTGDVDGTDLFGIMAGIQVPLGGNGM